MNKYMKRAVYYSLVVAFECGAIFGNLLGESQYFSISAVILASLWLSAAIHNFVLSSDYEKESGS